MQSIHMICVGKLKEPFYAAAMAEYAKRLGAYCKLAVQELAEVRLPESPSDAERDAALAREGAEVLAALPRGAAVVAMCIEGRTMSSEDFAARLASWPHEGKSTVCFIIGSSNGLHESVKARADLRLSMSPMTFPHHLARVLLAEQIYRAFQISAGGRYHK